MNIEFGKSDSLDILCLGAHCDDIEIGAGGTLLKIFKEYKINKVTWIVFTSNDIRKNEALISAEQFLSEIPDKSIIIKNFRDGFLPFQGIELKEYFEELKNDLAPSLIFTHFRDDRHQDHRMISDLTWNTWRSQLIFEYEIPKYDGDLAVPNLYFSLDEKYIKKKNQILLNSFKSQKSKHWFSEDTFKALPRIRGLESATQFAEAFYVRKLVM